MATLPSFFLLLILFLVVHTRTSAEFTCESKSCESGGISIRFPFSLRQSNQSQRCGYPGFELSCSKSNNTSLGLSQPLLTFPESGNFVAKRISIKDQMVWINDPEECLPKRFMGDHGLNLKGSPFRLADYYTFVDFSFLNCPSNLTYSSLVQPISCLNLGSDNNNNSSGSNLNDSVVVAMMSNPPFPTSWTSSCQLITTASIPVGNMPSLFWTDYYSNIPLLWDDPDCKNCEERGGRCGFLGDPAFLVCHDLPDQDQGLSSKVKYGITMGLGIPGLLGICGLVCFLCSKKDSVDQRRQTSTEFSTLIIRHTPVVVMGLDGATIEKFPKTQLGESGRLPKPSDNVCSICLCEYQPKEVLRTIPECNHYFHANCIDGWLKMNATCPLCRNLPERSTSFPSPLPLSPSIQ